MRLCFDGESRFLRRIRKWSLIVRVIMHRNKPYRHTIALSEYRTASCAVHVI